MGQAQIRDDIDPKSSEYRRNLIIVLMLVIGLTVAGGLFLGYKIRSAENAAAADEAVEAPAGERDGRVPEEGAGKR